MNKILLLRNLQFKPSRNMSNGKYNWIPDYEYKKSLVEKKWYICVDPNDALRQWSIGKVKRK